MWVIEVILFSYFSFSVLYVLTFSIGALFKKDHVTEKYSTAYNKIAILVPAYKEDNVIVHSAQSLLKLNYPKEFFDVVVISDSLKSATLKKLQELPIKLIEANLARSTKANSLNLALNKLEEEYDIAVISDADNIMHKDFLNVICSGYNKGFRAMQGRRVAKNLNTPFAILDATNEIINNHIFRKGFNALGLSSALIGSGMAFDYNKLKAFMSKINAVGGFDKELQLLFIENGIKIHYLEKAIVFDEKIEEPTSFERQRRRWLSSQYIYFLKYLPKGTARLLQGKLSYFNIAVLYNIFLPRSLTITCLFIISIVSSILHPAFSILYMYWWILLGVYIASLLIAIPKQFYDSKLLTALIKLPYAILIMLKSLLKIKGADKQFIHTTHTRTEIDESIFYSE